MFDERGYLDLISGERRDREAVIWRSLLRGLAYPYEVVMRMRNIAYDAKLLPAVRLPVPVISVGNLTTGGTGKTPVVAWLVNLLVELGRRPGIASRGYRSLGPQGNDEKLVLDRLCPGVPHRQGRNRVVQARDLIAVDRCDVIVLDDGFQHRRLARDFDVVLIDATRPWGFGSLLPGGLLREPVSSLHRADVVLITRCDMASPAVMQSILDRVKRLAPRALTLTSQFELTHLLFGNGSRAPISSLKHRRLFLFSGIANPASFEGAVASHGQVVDRLRLPDHCAYEARQIAEIAAAAHRCAADIAVTTLKDFVKLSRLPRSELPIAACEQTLRIDDSERESLLRERLRRLCDDWPSHVNSPTSDR